MGLILLIFRAVGGILLVYAVYCLLVLAFRAIRILLPSILGMPPRTHADEEGQRPRQDTQGRIVKDDNYYADILGLNGQVTRGDVKERYRDLAAKYHPDKVSHLGDKIKRLADEEMKQINEAYEYFCKKYGS